MAASREWSAPLSACSITIHSAAVAAEQAVPLIPVRRAFLWDQNYCRMISPDGIHLNMTGYRRLFDTIGQWAQEHLT